MSGIGRFTAGGIAALALGLAGGTAGCADDEGGGEGGGGSGGGAAPVTLTGRSTAYFDDGPVAGVHVCVDGTETCADSNEDGVWTLANVPGEAEVLLTMESAEHVPFVRHVTTGAADMDVGEFPHFTNGEVGALAAFLGVEYVETDGHVIFQAQEHDAEGKLVPLAGVHYEIEPNDGTIGYVSDEGAPDETLTATQSAGLGGVLGLTPGPAKLRFSHETRTCIPDPAWNHRADETGAVPVVVRPGHVTLAGHSICDP